MNLKVIRCEKAMASLSRSPRTGWFWISYFILCRVLHVLQRQFLQFLLKTLHLCLLCGGARLETRLACSLSFAVARHWIWTELFVCPALSIESSFGWVDAGQLLQTVRRLQQSGFNNYVVFLCLCGFWNTATGPKQFGIGNGRLGWEHERFESTAHDSVQEWFEMFKPFCFSHEKCAYPQGAANVFLQTLKKDNERLEASCSVVFYRLQTKWRVSRFNTFCLFVLSSDMQV